MTEELLAAIQEGDIWMKQFTRRDYERAFHAYRERFLPVYLSALREKTPEALADAILDALEEGWRHTGFWKRGMAQTNDKAMLVGYLSPMLLDQAEAACGRLAELLRDGWNTRLPKNGYQIASYETIKGGFRSSILGFVLPDGQSEKP